MIIWKNKKSLLRKNNMEKVVDICFASDDSYAPHLWVAIFSLIKNLNKSFLANIFILDWWIRKENKEKILKSIANFKNFKIYYLKFENSSYKEYPCNIWIATYYRLEIWKLLKNIKKILYIDCDVIIDKDLSKIFSYDITNYYFWAVSEITLRNYYKDKLNFWKDSIFFNAWVLLLNLEKIRKEKFFEKVKKYIIKNKDNLFDNDQQALNQIWKNQWLNLEPKYNSLPLNFYTKKYKNLWYKKKEFFESIENPIIIHYAWEKPWKYFCDHPKKNIYWLYRNQTAFKNRNAKNIDKFSIKWFFKFINNRLFIFFMVNLSEKNYYYLIYKPKQIITKLIQKLY